jgi:hypothetical protein
MLRRPTMASLRRKKIVLPAIGATTLAVGGVALAASLHQFVPNADRPAPNALKHLHARVPPSVNRAARRPRRRLDHAAVNTLLTGIAARTAARYGDPNPASAEWVLTSRRAANQVDGGDAVDSNQQVYYIVLHGNFVGKYAYYPAGASPPTGHILAFTIDAATNEPLDLSLSDHPRDIAGLGRPAPLNVP